MPFLNKNLQFDTPAAFAAWLDNQPRPNWGPIGTTFHHTWKPNQQTWAGHASMQSMQEGYEAKGWDRGPHLFLASSTRDDGIWVMTSPSVYGIHAGPCNDGPDGRFGVEIVDDLSTQPMSEAQLQLLVDVTAELHRWARLPANINAHRDCMPDRTCPGDAGYAQKPEIQRRLALALAGNLQSAVTSHGLVLTNTTSLNSLEDSVMAGSYDTIKVVTSWGLDAPWRLETRARLCAMSCSTIVRTHAGDPSSGKPFPHFEEVRDELAPWYAIKPRSFFEIGNEPNIDGTISPAGYAYHLNLAIDICRQLYPRARLISPALDMGRSNAAPWLGSPEFAAAIRRCDVIGVHAYAFVNFDDTGQFAEINQLYAPFRDKAWALTEYGINDKATSDATKGQRYATLVKSLPAPYRIATFYHRDDAPTNSNDQQYAIDLSGDRAYGAVWRSP